MKVVDIEKLDWRQDPDYVAAEQKMERLVDRETQDRARLAELEIRERDLERSLPEARAAELLDDSSSEKVRELLRELRACQVESAELRDGLVALELAKEKHGRTVEDAAAQARMRLAETCLGPYIKAAQTLRQQLDQAVETNRLLDAIYRKVTKEGLNRQIYGSPQMKPLGLYLGLDLLSVVNGARHIGFNEWITRHDNVLAKQ